MCAPAYRWGASNAVCTRVRRAGVSCGLRCVECTHTVFVFFNPTAKTYMPPHADNLLVKPKGTRSYHLTHPSRQFFLFSYLFFENVSEGFFFPYQNSSDFALTST